MTDPQAPISCITLPEAATSQDRNGQIKEKPIRTLGRLSLLALLTAAGGLCASGAQAQPKVTFPGAPWDFGQVLQDQAVSHQFEVKNVGKDTLFISRVKPACGCTSAPLTRDIVGPGESVWLDVTFSTKKFSGNVTKSVAVFCNDPATRRPSSTLPPMSPPPARGSRRSTSRPIWASWFPTPKRKPQSRSLTSARNRTSCIWPTGRRAGSPPPGPKKWSIPGIPWPSRSAPRRASARQVHHVAHLRRGRQSENSNEPARNRRGPGGVNMTLQRQQHDALRSSAGLSRPGLPGEFGSWLRRRSRLPNLPPNHHSDQEPPSTMQVVDQGKGVSITERGRGKLQVVSDTWDFGYIPQEASVSHRYILENVGDDTLFIEEVKPTCGCTVANLAKEPPGTFRQGAGGSDLQLQEVQWSHHQDRARNLLRWHHHAVSTHVQSRGGSQSRHGARLRHRHCVLRGAGQREPQREVPAHQSLGGAGESGHRGCTSRVHQGIPFGCHGERQSSR